VTFLANQLGQIAVRRLNDRLEMFEVADPLRDGMAEFVEMPPQRIHQFSALVDKALPTSEQHRSRLLLLRLWLNKTHLGALGRNDNCLGIGRVVFLPLY